MNISDSTKKKQKQKQKLKQKQKQKQKKERKKEPGTSGRVSVLCFLKVADRGIMDKSVLMGQMNT